MIKLQDVAVIPDRPARWTNVMDHNAHSPAENYPPPLVDGVFEGGVLDGSVLPDYGATVRVPAYPRIGFDELTIFWSLFLGGASYVATLPISIPVKPNEQIVFTVPLLRVRGDELQQVTVGYFVRSWDGGEYYSPPLNFFVSRA